VDNLRQEGIHGNRVALVGNTMIDSLATLLDEAKAGNAVERFGVVPGEFALVTLHRPASWTTRPCSAGRSTSSASFRMPARDPADASQN
jgi:UDP-N-acetylglucosamine 2-epimerase